MARSKITFTLGQGNSPGVIENNDGISALQFYGTAPGSFATTACQAVFGVADAETKGITKDFSDETKAAGSLIITGVGAIGDKIVITVTEKNPLGATTTVTLCTYTQLSSDTTATILATSIIAAINANSYLTNPSDAVGGVGYTAAPASPASGTINLIARTGLGINLNGTSPVATVTGAITVGTITAFSGGVYSAKALWHYTIKRYFAKNPNGKVWVQFTAAPSGSFTEVYNLTVNASGEPRQMGILNFVAKSAVQVTTDLNSLQTQYALMFAAYQPCEMLYVPNIAGVSNLATLQNLQSVGNAQNCLPVISQDGGAEGAQLYINSGVSVSNLGDILGTAAIAAVSQDIGEVGAFNISDGTENNIPGFTNGNIFSTLNTTSPGLLDQLDSYRYLFCVTYSGFPGTFVNNDWTAIIQTNAYNRLCSVRTIDKVLREQYIALLPLLKSRIYLNSDGTMTQTTIEKYIDAAEPGIVQMVNDGDLSPGNLTGTGLTTGVVNISATQNVKTQGYIAITYDLLQVNIADNINVTLQFTQKL